YLFMAAMGLIFLVAAVRAATGELPQADLSAPGVVSLGDPGNGWLHGASLFIVLRAFANGGSSLTGLEAISNGISAFREPQGRNARRTLIAMSCVLAVL
ncbi:DNA-binding protein, partial [Streptomyces sp. SID7499]|nr:DNA-binding protein [Streptomyces sp. SID7499]